MALGRPAVLGHPGTFVRDQLVVFARVQASAASDDSSAAVAVAVAVPAVAVAVAVPAVAVAVPAVSAVVVVVAAGAGAAVSAGAAAAGSVPPEAVPADNVAVEGAAALVEEAAPLAAVAAAEQHCHPSAWYRRQSVLSAVPAGTGVLASPSFVGPSASY